MTETFTYAAYEAGEIHCANQGNLDWGDYGKTLCGKSLEHMEFGDETQAGLAATCQECRTLVHNRNWPANQRWFLGWIVREDGTMEPGIVQGRSLWPGAWRVMKQNGELISTSRVVSPQGDKLTTEPDRHGNFVRQEGCDRCECGCKYWELDRCVDCGGTTPSTLN